VPPSVRMAAAISETTEGFAGTNATVCCCPDCLLYTGGWIEAVDLESGRREVLYRDCCGVPLNGPNDLVFDSHGGMWFTDHGRTHRRSRDRGAVYYARPDGSSIREAIFPLDAPNGIGLSPDGEALYVSETHTARLWALEIERPGYVRQARGKLFEIGRLVVGLGGYRLFDSLAVEASGNICLATVPDGISVISPDGSLIEQISSPDPITTNICSAGRTWVWRSSPSHQAGG
jgi:gluconolactonase